MDETAAAAFDWKLYVLWPIVTTIVGGVAVGFFFSSRVRNYFQAAVSLILKPVRIVWNTNPFEVRRKTKNAPVLPSVVVDNVKWKVTGFNYTHEDGIVIRGPLCPLDETELLEQTPRRSSQSRQLRKIDTSHYIDIRINPMKCVTCHAIYGFSSRRKVSDVKLVARTQLRAQIDRNG